MASTTPISVSSSAVVVDNKAAAAAAATALPPHRQCATANLPAKLASPLHHQAQSRIAKTTAYCKKMARNVVAMATSTGEAPPTDIDVDTTELPDFVKTIQETWDKVEDKYAVSSLAVAGVVALWGSTGLISAIDRLPLVPGVLELVGIGYTGWFAYKNLVFKPDREALIEKVKNTYKDIIGTS